MTPCTTQLRDLDLDLALALALALARDRALARAFDLDRALDRALRWRVGEWLEDEEAILVPTGGSASHITTTGGTPT